MKYLVCVIHPFILDQEVSVYDGDECIKTFTCELSDLDKTLYAYCMKENIRQIKLSGSQLYALKIKDDFVDNKFDNSESIQIDII